MSAEDAKQRLMAIRVNEVSLVGIPANEEPFIITKSLDDEQQGVKAGILKEAWTAAEINKLPDSAFLYVETGGKKDDEGKTVPRSNRHFPYKGPSGAIDGPHLRNALARIPDSDVPDDVKTRITAEATSHLAEFNKTEKGDEMPNNDKPVAKAELDAYTAQIVTMQAVSQAVWDVQDKLRDGDVAGATQAMERMKTMLENAAQLTEETTKLTKGLEGLTALVQKAKADNKGKLPPALMDNMKKAMELLKAMADEPDADDKPAEKGVTEVQKAVNQIGELIGFQQDGSIVLKAGKSISKKNMGTLGDAVKGIMGMLKEADPDSFYSMVSSWSDQKTGTDVVAAKAGEAQVAKGGEAPPWFQTFAADVKKGLDGLTERVQSVEKGQAGSKALPNNQTDKNGDNPTEPVKKNFWTGVL